MTVTVKANLISFSASVPFYFFPGKKKNTPKLFHYLQTNLMANIFSVPLVQKKRNLKFTLSVAQATPTVVSVALLFERDSSNKMHLNYAKMLC